MRGPVYENLDYFADLLEKTIQCNLDPVTELYFSNTGTGEKHAWIRDNLWAVQSVWALALSFRKYGDTDDARAKFQMFAGSATKTMRSLLMCMMRQSSKIESFKKTKATGDAIHAKFNVRTLSTVVGDHDWGHLQLDATGLFVLQLAQMTASGLQIILSLEEVDFIQNLVFYIESAYKTVDYGIWERGDKTNHGVPELNASSIGMCLAALEAIDGLDLFQCQGGYRSIIHVSPDEKARCQDVLESLLPRESKSKEVGAALLPVVLYPAFAVSNSDIVTKTLAIIDEKLQGEFGYIRFQRDGYLTPIEDRHRLHYDPLELEQFEKIECQWPLFLCMRLVSKCFQRGAAKPQVNSVAMERKAPGSAKRDNVGFLPHIWGQSLYILSRLLVEDFVSPGELDPLNRRMAMQKRPEVIVQVSFLALDDLTQDTFNEHGHHFQRAEDITKVRVHPVTVLSDLYKNLGKSDMLCLSGRPKGRIGILSTSKFYELGDGTMTFFYPEFSNIDQNWIAADVNIFIEEVQTELNYIQSHWNHPGRPTIVIPLSTELIWNTSDSCVHSEIINLVRKITSGYIAGVRVKSAKLEEFLPTSNVSKLQFADVKDGISPKSSASKTLSLPKLPITPMRSPKDFHKARVINMNLDLTDMTLVPKINRRRSESHSFTSTRSGRDDSYTILTAKCLVDQAGVLLEISEATDENYRVQIPSVGPVQITPLLEEVFDRACREQQWLLARELAGYLNKPLPGLDQAVTDILVRQKSITVGLPPDSRETTIDKPLQSGEIEAMILEACGDGDVAILQQEVILCSGSKF
ncbi:Oidioi.mRNA.OKI2018_I69.chr2.g8273.t1.cds [Oikopleura dioica]|uniref:Phosphorylase b kinase regulatory subunit n=1 Tax=Oikopleura dioica TaxID=34765 RepID=A0ABN7T9A5_OIKDI|nr:Oidioi.mRNA.OKI2018_I69.chr2.g8273.t1.cds [Oikopleura dioica]